jgi:uncharacterized membrane protein
VEFVLTEWLSLLVRWLHVIAGMAWIGSSFYFIHLDLSLKARAGLPDGVKGDAWQVHGGGFYHMIKYLVAPTRMPDQLTWFKWEAYTTWLSGFALLVIVYYLGAELYLIDKRVLDVSAPTAAAIAFGSLLVAWLFYEALCRSPLRRHEVAMALCELRPRRLLAHANASARQSVGNSSVVKRLSTMNAADTDSSKTGNTHGVLISILHRQGDALMTCG